MRPLDWATAAAVLPAAGSFLANSAHQTVDSFSDWLAKLSPSERAEETSADKESKDLFIEQITVILRKSGIDLSSPLEIEYDPYQGEFELSGEHPQKLQIEALLNGEKSLVEQARRLAAAEGTYDNTTLGSDFWTKDRSTFRIQSAEFGRF